jgi:hypothetical protein
VSTRGATRQVAQAEKPKAANGMDREVAKHASVVREADTSVSS